MPDNKLSLRQRIGLRLLGDAKSVPLGALLPAWKENRPIWADWSTDKAVREGFKASTYVYACVYRLMKSAASVPWRVKQRNKAGEWEIVPDHPLERLIESPNPFMSRQDMIERLTAHLYLGGNGLWTKVRANGIVVELWPIGPDGIKPVPNREEFISHYKYDKEGVTKRIETADIIHWMFTDPSNVFWGLSPLQAGARTVDTDVEAVRWNKIALQNRAVADGVFSFKHAITIEQYEDAKKMVREQHQGADNARTPWVLGSDANWLQMSLSPVDMDFIEGRKMTQEEICSIFGVPPPLVGIYENATLANIEVARKILWLDTVIPYLEDIQGGANRSLTPDFGPDLMVEPDFSNVEAIQDNFKEKVETAERLWKMAVPFNDINQRLELGFRDDIPGGDVGYLPATLLPAGSPIEAAKSFGIKSWNVHTEEQKTVFWKVFERRRTPWYQVVERRTRELLEKEASLIEKAYLSGGTEVVMAALDKSREAWVALLRALYLAIMGEFARDTYDQILGTRYPAVAKQFDPWDVLINSWSENWAAARATLITGTSKQMAQHVITQGLSEGLSVDQIARGLRMHYDEDAVYRSYRMARTEVVGASNYGSWAGAKMTDLNPRRTWVSSRDGRVRDDHVTADGQKVGIDDPFLVGGEEMNYPGDPTASGKQTIHCRCAVTYEVEGRAVEELEGMQRVMERGHIPGANGRDQLIQEAGRRGQKLSKTEAHRMTAAVDAFTGGYDYSVIRASQRGATEFLGGGIGPGFVGKAGDIERFINLSASFPKSERLVRGVKTAERYTKLKVGSVVDFGGTSSWTTSMEVATESFAGPKGAVIVLKNSPRASTSVMHISRHEHEAEVLVSDKVRARITRIGKGTVEGQTYPFIYLEEVV